jgi:hypothetical protein
MISTSLNILVRLADVNTPIQHSVSTYKRRYRIRGNTRYPFNLDGVALRGRLRFNPVALPCHFRSHPVSDTRSKRGINRVLTGYKPRNDRVTTECIKPSEVICAQ